MNVPKMSRSQTVSGCDQTIMDMRHHIVIALGRTAAWARDGVLTAKQREILEKSLYDALDLANTHDRERQRAATDLALAEAANKPETSP